MVESSAEEGLSVIIDDPSEVAFQPISWYLARLETSFAVLMELGTQTGARGSLHIAKCALVAGVSVACGRRLLMLEDGIDEGPIDYHDLLRSYKNAADAVAITNGSTIDHATPGRVSGNGG